jgi:type IV fimbrial biogenesis protein FimT
VLTSSGIRTSGFTILEMMVTIGIFAILVALTVPTMSTWVANTRVRAVADALQNGVRMAQTESLRRSRQVVFALTNDSPTAQNPAFTAVTNGKYWAVETIPAMVGSGEVAAFIASGVLSSVGSTIAIQGPAEICFNSIGRLVVNTTASVPGGGGCTPGGGAKMSYTYKITAGTGAPEFDVQVALGGQMRLCDPNQTLTASNPYGCAP